LETGFAVGVGFEGMVEVAGLVWEARVVEEATGVPTDDLVTLGVVGTVLDWEPIEETEETVDSGLVVAEDVTSVWAEESVLDLVETEGEVDREETVVEVTEGAWSVEDMEVDATDSTEDETEELTQVPASGLHPVPQWSAEAPQ
jgi:hypothetical protein